MDKCLKKEKEMELEIKGMNRVVVIISESQGKNTYNRIWGDVSVKSWERLIEVVYKRLSKLKGE